MKTLPKPPFQARTVFEACAASRQDIELKARLLSIAPAIEQAEYAYQIHGQAGQLHVIKEETIVSGKVTGKEMESLYTESFVRKGSKNRYIYDQIKMAAPHGICPLCGQRVVSTLDHYLAKTKHPALAVSPLNLVPACADCNKLKHAHQPVNAEEQTFHPYFDDLGKDVWLTAVIGQTQPPSISYSATPPENWSAVKKQRLRNHFVTYELANLYGAQASAELVDIKHGLLTIGQRGHSHEVHIHLVREADSRTAADPNSWKAAMYRALAESEWFCRCGYLLIS
ncbi:MAG: hypothetical protein KJ795_15155 [Gammaproteobacteria bacterium]|nr:hypothetical protein [Gammaproteobacteria bacterium]MBU1776670.1 hypothetical protein [Gammaproteobacteria bacterium]MBU1968515.1 hypothetical protein [Gammaproteobacteria bacterium]